MLKNNVPLVAIIFWTVVISVIIMGIVFLHLYAMQAKKKADQGHEELKDSFKNRIIKPGNSGTE